MEIECSECRTKLPLKVCQSAAGYYLGYWCPNHGPYSRESGYYGAKEEADKALEDLLEYCCG